MFVNICTFAQETYTLKGKVTSKVDNEGLPGVSIRILDSNSGSDTDSGSLHSSKMETY